jgi:hypothetical protein
VPYLEWWNRSRGANSSDFPRIGRGVTSLRRFCARVAEDGTAGSARYNVFNATDNVSFDFRNATYVGGDASALLPLSGGGAHVSHIQVAFKSECVPEGASGTYRAGSCEAMALDEFE